MWTASSSTAGCVCRQPSWPIDRVIVGADCSACSWLCDNGSFRHSRRRSSNEGRAGRLQRRSRRDQETHACQCRSFHAIRRSDCDMPKPGRNNHGTSENHASPLPPGAMSFAGSSPCRTRIGMRSVIIHSILLPTFKEVLAPSGSGHPEYDLSVPATLKHRSLRIGRYAKPRVDYGTRRVPDKPNGSALQTTRYSAYCKARSKPMTTSEQPRPARRFATRCSKS
jgi:hypothetical protein